MFQSFETSADPSNGPARLTALRAAMQKAGVDGFLVPKADAHQGEYVAPRDDRLAWLTGFTGSAGFACVLQDIAGVFVDGRYRLQVRDQVADVFTPVDWPGVQLGDWVKEKLPSGSLAFDPWLHTVDQVEQLSKTLQGHDIALTASANLIDAVWDDQPAAPQAKAFAQPIEFAGEPHEEKRKRLGESLRANGCASAVITLPDSICWLLNIRGADIPRNPVMQAFAVLHSDGKVDLFVDPIKVADLADHFGPDVSVFAPDTFIDRLGGLHGPVLLDKSSAPMAIASILAAKGIDISYGADPCAMPKACKNAAELDGTTEAHLRDGAAMVNFLAWFDAHSESGINEIDVAEKLEGYRQATGALRDISFDSIVGTGPHGAVIHYRVTHNTARVLQSGEIMVLDSGGQYVDGTTDITRTLPIGPVGEEEKRAFTLVLKGMINVSELRWPAGLAGRDLEAVGRVPLWQAGLDFDHGLGHGVGVYLCVHEGPQRLSKVSDVPLKPGMILSNEPGYYKPGAFGIRIENLVVVEKAPILDGADSHRAMLQFRTLTYAPIDRRLISAHMLTQAERDWLNAYHQDCYDKLVDRIDDEAKAWLTQATKPL
ncbi:aminopeptidase P family protein [Cognatishimia activa]|uniref:Putative peptidase n=1 Tax=Cognatishimia activa TaxID=1715691 RepID=A0A0P1IPM0_9RHOB|nr:aminopeptidase P family protein [Cognatishimia activa]CUJ20471.1 putative peptidase [Cognatishimia activa]CUK25498.1 putative peptidase [Cognatishimia activa]